MNHLLVMMEKLDCDNEILDKLMNYERHPPSDNTEEYDEDYTFILNHLWLDELKKVSKWERGKYLFCFIKTNADGYFNVWYSFDKKLFDNGWYNDLIIEPNGYVVRKFWNIYDNFKSDGDVLIPSFYHIRVRSYYNDRNCKELKVKTTGIYYYYYYYIYIYIYIYLVVFLL